MDAPHIVLQDGATEFSPPNLESSVVSSEKPSASVAGVPSQGVGDRSAPGDGGGASQNGRDGSGGIREVKRAWWRSEGRDGKVYHGWNDTLKYLCGVIEEMVCPVFLAVSVIHTRNNPLLTTTSFL